MVRRGTCIIETKKGILIGKEFTDGRYSLIGGQAKPGEHRRDAAIRELKEETGLDAMLAIPLFNINTTSSNGRVTEHQAVLIKAQGTLQMNGPYTAVSNCRELQNLGFFNLYYINNSDLNRYQGHVYAVLKEYETNYRNTYVNQYFSNDIQFK